MSEQKIDSTVDPLLLSESLVGHDRIHLLWLFAVVSGFSAEQKDRKAKWYKHNSFSQIVGFLLPCNIFHDIFPKESLHLALGIDTSVRNGQEWFLFALNRSSILFSKWVEKQPSKNPRGDLHQKLKRVPIQKFYCFFFTIIWVFFPLNSDKWNIIVLYYIYYYIKTILKDFIDTSGHLWFCCCRVLRKRISVHCNKILANHIYIRISF